MDYLLFNLKFTVMSNYHLSLMPSDCYSLPVCPDVVNGVNNGFSVVDSSLYDTLCPVNPLTGHRDSMLSRLFSGDVSDTEKQLIMSQLVQLKGVSSPSELSDDDVLNLLPSRYMSDPVELDRYRQIVDELRNNSVSDTLDNHDDTEPGSVSPDPGPGADPVVNS